MSNNSTLAAALPMLAAIRALVAQLPDPALRARIEAVLDGRQEPSNEIRAEVLSGDQAAALLGCKRRCVQKLASEGRIRIVKLPGRQLGCGYLRSDVEKLLAGEILTPRPKAAKAEAEARPAAV